MNWYIAAFIVLGIIAIINEITSRRTTVVSHEDKIIMPKKDVLIDVMPKTINCRLWHFITTRNYRSFIFPDWHGEIRQVGNFVLIRKNSADPLKLDDYIEVVINKKISVSNDAPKEVLDDIDAFEDFCKSKVNEIYKQLIKDADKVAGASWSELTKKDKQGKLNFIGQVIANEKEIALIYTLFK